MSDILYTDGYMSGKSEAADEIEALKAEIERLQAEIVLFTELQRASNQKIERLRAALQDMFDLHGHPHREEWMNDTAFELSKRVYEQARRALDGEKG